MDGVDPYAFMQQVAIRMDQLNSRNEIERTLDQLEYLFEVMPPEMQDLADQLDAQLRSKLEQAE